MGAAPATQAEGPASCEAIASLVCAICGLFVAGVILGPIAICLGLSAKKKIKNNPGEHGGQCLATSGIVMGIFSIFFSIIAIGFLLSAE